MPRMKVKIKEIRAMTMEVVLLLEHKTWSKCFPLRFSEDTYRYLKVNNIAKNSYINKYWMNASCKV